VINLDISPENAQKKEKMEKTGLDVAQDKIDRIPDVGTTMVKVEDSSVTSATDTVILLKNVKRMRTSATDAKEMVTLPETVLKMEISLSVIIVTKLATFSRIVPVLEQRHVTSVEVLDTF